MRSAGAFARFRPALLLLLALPLLPIAGTAVTVNAVAAPATRAHPILPPHEPSKNFRLASVRDVRASIDAARRSEEALGPLRFNTTRWKRLSVAEQVFVTSNLERTARGLYPAMAMVRRLNLIALSAAHHDQDPIDQGRGFSSNWSSAPSTLGQVADFADFGWMYDDGPPPQYIFRNVDCARAQQSGCWGHRDNILSRPLANWSGCPAELVSGTGYAASTPDGPSVTQIFEVVCTNSHIGATFTWRYAVKYLAIPASQSGLAT